MFRRWVQIPKPRGGTRQLGIPTVVDRLVQQAMLQVLEPILDPHFSESSCGFRPDAARMMRCGRQRSSWLADVQSSWTSIAEG